MNFTMFPEKCTYLLSCNKRTSTIALRRVQMSEGFEEQVGYPVPNRRTQRKKDGGTNCVEHQDVTENTSDMLTRIRHR